jgi:hypothetical protein
MAITRYSVVKHMDAVKTKQITITVSDKWYGELARLANTYGLSIQDIIRDWIGEQIGLLPTCQKLEEKKD